MESQPLYPTLYENNGGEMTFVRRRRQVDADAIVAAATQQQGDRSTIIIKLSKPVIMVEGDPSSAGCACLVTPPTHLGRSEKLPDVVIPRTMDACGFPDAEKYIGNALPSHVLAFLCAHATAVMGHTNKLTHRVFCGACPLRAMSSSTWRDLSLPTGNTIFCPRFWARLVRDLDCHLSQDLASANFMLTDIAGRLCSRGIKPSLRAIFIAMILDMLHDKNATKVASDKHVAKCVFGREASTMEVLALADYTRDNPHARNITNEDAEEAWTVMLCSMVRRTQPLVPQCYNTGLIPVSADTMAAQRERRLLIHTEQQQKRNNDVVVKPHSHEGQELLHTNTPLLVHSDDTPKMVTISEPKPPPSPAFPMLNVEDETMASITALTEYGTDVTEASRGYTIAATLTENALIKAFQSACGISTTTNTSIVTRAVVVALFGGPRWGTILNKLIPGLQCKTEDKTNLALLSPEIRLRIFDMIPTHTLAAVPMTLFHVQQEFGDTIGKLLKSEDYARSQDKRHNFLVMMMILYSGDGSDWRTMWRSKQWTLNTDVSNAIHSWIKQRPTLPVPVRAAILATVRRQ